jgi:uncharacterized membrane protein (DUF2068 family)
VAERTDRLLRWIAAERSLRAAFLIAVGVVLLTHVHTDWGRVLRQEAIRWGLHPSDGGLGRVLRRISHIGPGRVGVYGAIAVGYGVLEGVEAYGLWRRRRWAEWLTVVVTSLLFIPEVWELAKRPSVFKVAALIVNAAIVAYLIKRLRDRR